MPNRKCIWVMGAPRSGTTLVTRWIGQAVEHCFNENIRLSLEVPLRRWALPDEGNFVHKWCHNFLYADRLLALHPESYFVWVRRDALNVIFSMACPKERSRPPRSFPHLGYERRERLLNALYWYGWHMHGCRSVSRAVSQRRITVQYETLPDERERLSRFLDLELPPLTHFVNRNIPGLKLSWQGDILELK